LNNNFSFNQSVAEEIIARLGHGTEQWGKLPVKARVQSIRRLRRIISQRADEIASAISEECHRPLLEAMGQEVLPTLEMARYCENNFPRWLAVKKMRYARPGFFRKKNLCFYDPIGLVGLITPANFPFSLAMMSLTYLLLAGNTVALKPSEHSDQVAPLIGDLLNEAEIAPDVAGLVSGGPDAGTWIIDDPRIQKIFFFSNRNNGAKIASACHRIGKPYVAEMGGSATAVVCQDANIDVAVKGIVWSACYANGQSCLGTNRVIVEKGVASAFLQQLQNYITIHQQTTTNSEPHQKQPGDDEDHWDELIADAISRGAQVWGASAENATGVSHHHAFPVVLTGVDPTMRVWSEEAFGALIAVMATETAESALAAISGDRLALGVSIWSRDLRRARSLAFSLPTRMIWINDISFGLPSLPWGGRDMTGKGTLFSQFSLHEVANIRWVSIHPHRCNRPKNWWYPYTKMKRKLFSFVARRLF